MKQFTTQNTEGFTEEQLSAMNERFDAEVANLDETNFYYRDECQNIAEKICDDFGYEVE